MDKLYSSGDDKNKAGARYEYDASVDLARLKRIVDPVTSRTITLRYSDGLTSGGQCANAPSGLGFAQQGPTGMLCAVDYWDGSHTYFYYTTNGSDGKLARIVDPGDRVTDYVYDGYGNLARTRSPLQSDWAAATSASSTNGGTFTLIDYHDDHTRGRQVTLASATGSSTDTSRTYHGYRYGSTDSVVDVSGTSPPQGYFGRAIFDASGRTASTTDNAGIVTNTTYDANDNVLQVVNASTGRATNNFFDQDNRLTDTYGPAQTSCFGSNRLPNGSCGSMVGHTSTEYDGALSGLAASYWATPNFSGGTVFHEHLSGAAGYSWGSGSPTNVPADNWTAQFTGIVQLPSSTHYTFDALPDDYARVYIDDQLMWSNWPGQSVSNQVVWNPTAGSWHRIRIDYQEVGGGAAVDVRWAPYGNAMSLIPASALKPNYGLATKSTTDDATYGNQVVQTTYSNVAYGVPSASIQDPSGLALSTQLVSESPTGTGYVRQTSKTLPAGNQTTYQYYDNNETPANPCGGSAVNQGGLMKSRTNPAPNTGGSVVEHYYYDGRGRTIATWTNNDAPTCSIFDAQGRLTTTSIPAFGAGAARTVSNNYNTTTTPLTVSVSDTAGTISTTLDLAGRTVNYTDVFGRTTTTSYDQAGRAVDSAAPGDVRTNTYDVYGRLDTYRIGTSAGSMGPIAAVGYNGSSEVQGYAFYGGSNGWVGNGTIVDVARDASGRTNALESRLASQPQWSSTYITKDEVSFSQSGRVKDQSIDSVDPNSSGNNFTYDAAGRLTDSYVPGHHVQYNFGNNPDCVALGGKANAGANSNRRYSIDNGAPSMNLCYDNADRVIWSQDSRYANPTYDSHGNTTSMGGTTMAYDMADRHVSTVSGATTVSYVRDATDRIIERKVNGSTVARYTYCGSGDNPCGILDGANTLQERIIALPGGVSVTKRSSGDLWSYPNIHGDVAATANSVGVKQGSTFTYDSFGQPLNGTPDNEAGNADNGWLGQYQRMTEHEGSLNTIEMGARQYVGGLGRFLSVDPVEGGSANDYDYVSGDPVNASDLAGTFTYSLSFDLGSSIWSAEQYFSIVRIDFGDLFPISGRPATLTGVGQKINLNVNRVPFPVTVSRMWSRGWRFDTRKGHPEYPGWIQFYFTKSGNGHVFLNIDAYVPNYSLGAQVGRQTYIKVAKKTWGGFASNLRSYMH